MTSTATTCRGLDRNREVRERRQLLLIPRSQGEYPVGQGRSTVTFQDRVRQAVELVAQFLVAQAVAGRSPGGVDPSSDGRAVD